MYFPQKTVNLHNFSAFFFYFMHYCSAFLLSLQQKYNDYVISRWDRYLGMTAAMTQVLKWTPKFGQIKHYCSLVIESGIVLGSFHLI